MTAAAAAPRPRRYRSLPEKLGSVILGFESIVVFLVGLVIYGLKALPEPIAPWWGIVAGSVLFVVTIALSGTLRWAWGRAAGWGLQILIALGAFLVPGILIAALVFGGMYAYAMIGGSRIERRMSAEAAARAAAGDQAQP
ncbi:DUF4233 domain-containing protein [Microbacterium indicum]|uniref:DUF4233 domain-containing protein n=1 Tax=Microbacterium indicum TaxID=358100 RepID=UPI000408152A|nr:DUF4233 domain-containing protein [Microbacterium indicum]